MNTDQVSGKFDQMKGKVKQGVGEAVGNQKLANEGVVDQVKGSTQGSLRQRQRRRAAQCGSRQARTEEKANQARANVVDNVDAAREHANEVVDSHR